METSTQFWKPNDKSGYGKPDNVRGNIEFRYLWKQFKPLTFDKWLETKN